MIRKKEEVINKFTCLQLEDLLNNSTKNVAQEVVQCLIPRKGEGVLAVLENAKSAEQKQPNQNDSAEPRRMHNRNNSINGGTGQKPASMQ